MSGDHPRHAAVDLTAAEAALLAEVLRKAAPGLAALLPPEGSLLVRDTTCMRMREAVLATLLADGFGPDDEPTSYGLRLEALVDRLGVG